MAPKQKQLDLGFFVPISKEEREINAAREFASLNERLQKEPAGEEITKRPVGRPKKEKENVLLRPSTVAMKPTTKASKKVRRRYTNWFTPTLWPPIHSAVKQHRSILNALGFLRSAYRKPRDLSCVYDSLSRQSMQ
jgi:hypothetical protein